MGYLQRVTFKPPAGFGQQFRRHREISLCGSNIDVTQVSSQLGEKPLDVRSCAIPGNQTVNGRGMPKIMKPWLIAAPIVAEYASAETHLAEGSFGELSGQRFSHVG